MKVTVRTHTGPFFQTGLDILQKAKRRALRSLSHTSSSQTHLLFKTVSFADLHLAAFLECLEFLANGARLRRLLPERLQLLG